MPFKTATVFHNQGTLNTAQRWAEPQPDDICVVGTIPFEDGRFVNEFDGAQAVRYRISEREAPSSAVDMEVTRLLGKYVHTKKARDKRRTVREQVKKSMSMATPPTHRHVDVITTTDYMIIMSATQSDVDHVTAVTGMDPDNQFEGEAPLIDVIRQISDRPAHGSLRVGDAVSLDVDGMTAAYNNIADHTLIKPMLEKATAVNSVELHWQGFSALVSNDWKLRSIDMGLDTVSTSECQRFVIENIPAFLLHVSENTEL